VAGGPHGILRLQTERKEENGGGGKQLTRKSHMPVCRFSEWDASELLTRPGR